MLKKLLSAVIEFFHDMGTVNRENATKIVEYEIEEMEHIFALLLFGSFTGMPSPPVHITLQLLPLMEKELELMLTKVATAHDALAEITEILGEI
ncbi:MAG: hypothetical protein KAR21_26250 [Spirochaetales bacterium]|nr:hypothetical protein [Spirochaetales bacterium]